MAGYPHAMGDALVAERLAEAARAARHAETAGDEGAAGEAWRRYRLIRDAARDPEELLAAGVALSEQARELAAQDRRGS
jgi:hypothetical protein